MKTRCLEVRGGFACFTRLDIKVERPRYNVSILAAARTIFEAVLWKPAPLWHTRRIEVHEPIRCNNLRSNEVGSIVSVRTVETGRQAASRIAWPIGRARITALRDVR